MRTMGDGNKTSRGVTRPEALPILARDVMGWPITSEWDGRVGVGEPRVTITGHTVEGKEPYNPWTNVQQALALAEAWRKQDYRQRWYAIDSPSPNTLDYQAQITEYSRGLDYVCSAVELSAALTGAVCKALGLEVTNAQ